jgi:hypothetical protein
MRGFMCTASGPVAAPREALPCSTSPSVPRRANFAHLAIPNGSHLLTTGLIAPAAPALSLAGYGFMQSVAAAVQAIVRCPAYAVP